MEENRNLQAHAEKKQRSLWDEAWRCFRKNKTAMAGLIYLCILVLVAVSTTVIDENKPARNGDHPTMKPLKLLARLIKNSSHQGDIVLDTFGGSGSTLITCEQLGRSCYTMELDLKYADVIVKRWLTFTGADHAELIRNGIRQTIEASRV